jgi:hypothetical protein
MLLLFWPEFCSPVRWQNLGKDTVEVTGYQEELALCDMPVDVMIHFSQQNLLLSCSCV